jgi:hypothetical protein
MNKLKYLSRRQRASYALISSCASYVHIANSSVTCNFGQSWVETKTSSYHWSTKENPRFVLKMGIEKGN